MYVCMYVCLQECVYVCMFACVLVYVCMIYEARTHARMAQSVCGLALCSPMAIGAIGPYRHRFESRIRQHVMNDAAESDVSFVQTLTAPLTKDKEK